MDWINDGGPAFPRPLAAHEAGEEPQIGMSVLDYFAVQAYVGILTRMNLFNDSALNNAAFDAYEAASALLRARGAYFSSVGRACGHSLVERDDSTGRTWCAECGKADTEALPIIPVCQSQDGHSMKYGDASRDVCERCGFVEVISNNNKDGS